jgi:hypothetical protein
LRAITHQVRQRPADAQRGLTGRAVLDHDLIRGEHDPHRRIALLHPQLDLDHQRAGLVGAPVHATFDDRHDRRGQAAVGQRAEADGGRRLTHTAGL